MPLCPNKAPGGPAEPGKFKLGYWSSAASSCSFNGSVTAAAEGEFGCQGGGQVGVFDDGLEGFDALSWTRRKHQNA